MFSRVEERPRYACAQFKVLTVCDTKTLVSIFLDKFTRSALFVITTSIDVYCT